MKTRRNIYHDLEESPFITKFNDFRFYFSSRFYQLKFEDNLLEYIKVESEKIKDKYNVNTNLSDVLAFNFYRNIEKRGCYCIYFENELKKFVIKDKMNCLIQVRK